MSASSWGRRRRAVQGSRTNPRCAARLGILAPFARASPVAFRAVDRGEHHRVAGRLELAQLVQPLDDSGTHIEISPNASIRLAARDALHTPSPSKPPRPRRPGAVWPAGRSPQAGPISPAPTPPAFTALRGRCGVPATRRPARPSTAFSPCSSCVSSSVPPFDWRPRERLSARGHRVRCPARREYPLSVPRPRPCIGGRLPGGAGPLDETGRLDAEAWTTYSADDDPNS
jgi:hypothetical protein